MDKAIRNVLADSRLVGRLRDEIMGFRAKIHRSQNDILYPSQGVIKTTENAASSAQSCSSIVLGDDESSYSWASSNFTSRFDSVTSRSNDNNDELDVSCMAMNQAVKNILSNPEVVGRLREEILRFQTKLDDSSIKHASQGVINSNEGGGAADAELRSNLHGLLAGRRVCVAGSEQFDSSTEVGDNGSIVGAAGFDEMAINMNVLGHLKEKI
ncbi:MAG: hypothetical protein QS748_12310 [Candidatus Endonucleobacter bathymodioli]|uniref:Uncharacterized protein n=1 Tax=Candidatus Endonucleibacter bathymodioli TaxID=539814 RepID=A0AA90NN84_9GAMM|nr:hypothetical protein [Candidatus Endonucleobacter bathymodioli]